MTKAQREVLLFLYDPEIYPLPFKKGYSKKRIHFRAPLLRHDKASFLLYLSGYTMTGEHNLGMLTPAGKGFVAGMLEGRFEI